MQRSRSFVAESVVIFGVIGLTLLLWPHIEKSDWAAKVVPITLIMVGIVLLITIGLIANRYQKTFDFEPAQFLGRQTNGKAIRSMARITGTLGCLFVIIGALLAFVVFFLSAPR